MLELHRSYDLTDVDGRTVFGSALTYDRPYRVTDDGRNYYREGWRAGAVRTSLEACRNTFELRAWHTDTRIGLVHFEDGATGLTFRAPLDESDAGEAALADVLAGSFPAVSLGFRPRQQQRDAKQVLWRTKADIRELSLAPRGQYADALVTAVRASPLT